MLKKTITFEDFMGNQRTEDHYFNLTKAEILDSELDYQGGMTQYIQDIINTTDGPALKELFKKIVLMSYGKISPDGRKFIKNAELTEDFIQTNAYSELFVELFTDATKAAAFINAIVPSDVAEAAKNIDTKQLGLNSAAVEALTSGAAQESTVETPAIQVVANTN